MKLKFEVHSAYDYDTTDKPRWRGEVTATIAGKGVTEHLGNTKVVYTTPLLYANYVDAEQDAFDHFTETLKAFLAR